MGLFGSVVCGVRDTYLYIVRVVRMWLIQVF